MERRLAAILAADIVGFSRQMSTDEERVLERQASLHKELIDPKIAEFGGRIFKTTGDGFLAEFSSVVDALRTAVNIQLAMKKRASGEEGSVDLVYRMGINLGDIVSEDDDVYGNGVNVAVRLEGLADPGGICVSQTVVDHVRGKVASDFTDLGVKSLKNIPDSVRVFRVEMRPEVESSGRPVQKTLPNRALIGGAVVCLAILTVLAWQRPWQSFFGTGSQNRAAVTVADKPTIAVLPFVNLSGDRSRDYFADGVTDDLISDLSRISGLFVISRNGSFSFKGKVIKIRDVASELGVRYVLEGSIKRSGKQIRINTQLIDAHSGGTVWAERYEKPEGDLFKVQNQIIGKVAEALSVGLTNEETQRLASQPTQNLEAYDYYLRAEKLGRDGLGNTEQEGLELYKRASELDPTFADAYTGYARIAVNVWHYEINGVMPVGLARKKAYDAITQAVKIDDRNARALAVLSRLQLLDGHTDLAITSARQSVALSPNGIESNVALANAYLASGQKEKSLAAISEAVRRNPNPPPHLRADLGMALFFNGEYQEAISNLEAAESAGVAYLSVLATAYAQTDQNEKARSTVQHLLAKMKRANLQIVRLHFSHFADQEDIQNIVSALRKAGLPEWPWSFRLPSTGKLSQSELGSAVFGRTWQGENMNVSPQFFQQIQKNGEFAYRDRFLFITGQFSIDEDRLCQMSVNYAMGRKQCGYVYRNSEETSEKKNEYIYVNTTSVLKFSITE